MIDLTGGPAAHPAPDRPGLVAGIGLRAGATVSDLLALLDACLCASGHDRADLIALATLEGRAQHPSLQALARQLAVPVLALAQADLARNVPNPSMRVADLAGLPSIAEASALSFGPLLLEKRIGSRCTCALSRYVPTDSLLSASASMAASTLATSSAGP